MLPARAAVGGNFISLMRQADLGIKGYEKVRLDGKVIYGQAWTDVNKDNLTEYSF